MDRSLDNAWFVANQLAGSPVKGTPWVQLTNVPEGTPAWSLGLRSDDRLIGLGQSDGQLAGPVAVWREGIVFGLEMPAPTPVNELLIGSSLREYIHLAQERPAMRQDRDIDGASAGAAHLLEYLDALTAGDLTGGWRIAITGEVGPDGQILEIGGMTDKTQAAVRAGAEILIVPEPNVGEARRAAAGQVTVIGVRTGRDIISWLCAAGSVPACRLSEEG